ncbi:TCR gamma alternate reading frame protein [Moschus berezovskii]|uniref:TCR gamma alternate reading frame protein n=1 Tax=Moschus berezovskii TaxID=68408 RepID=UPI002443CD2D|nr:TCR gamma alternate reading frame protein [Moschus berezovskii]
MALLEAVLFSSLWSFGLGQLTLEQPEVSVTGTREKSVIMSCKVFSKDFSKDYIHWYRQKPDQGLEQLLYVSAASALNHLGGKKNKLEAKKDALSSTSTLKISFLEKEDEATYYCAGWSSASYYVKIFGDGTKLVVTDRRLDGDLFPKPTIFFPSVEEVKLHRAGTHLCLLQNFFPDAIKVQWKEKKGNTILESHQGNIIKTNDTYMKFSWLTLTEKAMDKEHVCIVKHENNKGGRDQEILFSSFNKAVATHACMKKESDTLQVQFASTSAYYTYLLLLLKSVIYFSIIAFCVFRRTGIFSDGKIF